MDRNLVLAFALSMAVFVAWIAWQEEVRAPERRATLEAQRAQAAQETEESGPPSFKMEGPETTAPDRSVKIQGEEAAGKPSTTLQAAVEPAKQIPPWSGVLENDLVRIEFSNRGVPHNRLSSHTQRHLKSLSPHLKSHQSRTSEARATI